MQPDEALRELEKIRVVYCAGETDLPEVCQGRHVTWQEFFSQRNRILAICRQFGTAGPMGEALIDDGADGPPDPWPVESTDANYFVVDDQVNATSRHHHIEVREKSFLRAGFLQRLWELIVADPSWSLGIAVPSERYVFMRYPGIWTIGEPLKPYTNAAELFAAASI